MGKWSWTTRETVLSLSLVTPFRLDARQSIIKQRDQEYEPV
jgi:hypothetical protein